VASLKPAKRMRFERGPQVGTTGGKYHQRHEGEPYQRKCVVADLEQAVAYVTQKHQAAASGRLDNAPRCSACSLTILFHVTPILIAACPLRAEARSGALRHRVTAIIRCVTRPDRVDERRPLRRFSVHMQPVTSPNGSTGNP